MKLISCAFPSGGRIPERYTCDGEDVNPSLTIEDIPDGAVSLALHMEDVDSRKGTWTHWLAWNIPLHDTLVDAAELTCTYGRNG